MTLGVIDLLVLVVAVSLAIATWYSLRHYGNNVTPFLGEKGQTNRERPLGG